MTPNETYWDPARKPSVRIVYDNTLSKDEALAAAAEGKVDVVLDVTIDQARAFDGKGKASIHAKPAKTVLLGVFNQAKANSPWNDVALRRAVNQAIDRRKLIDKGANGWGTAMPVFIQPGRYGAVDGMEPYALDAAAAKAAIGKAGLHEVMLLASPEWKGVVDAITEDLAAVGITVKADYSKSETDPEGWDIKLVWYFDWSPQYPVGVVHREFFGHNGAFRSGPEDTAFDALYAKLLRTPHQPAQEGVVREVEQYVYDQAKALLLFSPHNLAAVSNRVEFTAYDTCMSELAETRIKSA